MIDSLFQKKQPLLSFEVFPPKKEDDFEEAFSILQQLATLQPDFMSVTYGAGGSKSKKTLDIASYIHNTLHIPAISHLTCVGFKKEDLLAYCQSLEQAGVKNVLALRGDRPTFMSDEQYHSRDFTYASEMIAFLQANTSLEIAAACYPEKHYEAESLSQDLVHLKEKCDAGASFLISQLFFDNSYFESFVDKAHKIGIHQPICAGIMPVTSAKQLGTTVSLSGSSVPKALTDLIAVYGDKPDEMKKAGLDYAIGQIMGLKEQGVDGIHLYTMNKPDIAKYITKNIS